MDLTSRLRAIVRPGRAAFDPSAPVREEAERGAGVPASDRAGGWGGAPPRKELTYEPDTGRYETTLDLDRVADVLGGQIVTNSFGRALAVDRRYESDRRHGSWRVEDCEFPDGAALRLLDPTLTPRAGEQPRVVFVDLETTGLSGGAGTMAFLVGCGWFDAGAFQVRQFLLTSYAAERALLSAVADCFAGMDLLVTYNGKTFDVPVMETRWMFHRMRMPLDAVRHFDMLHPARRLWRGRTTRINDADGSCRLSTLERVLCGVTRVGDVPGMEIPARYFRFLRSGDAVPLEPVLEHNRLDLISLAAVTAYAVRLVNDGPPACRDAAETLALGKVYDRAGSLDCAMDCFQAAAGEESADVEVRAEACYHLGRRLRRERRHPEAAEMWRRIVAMKQPRFGSRSQLLGALRQYAVEALAIHHEHRDRDYAVARELALQLLEDVEEPRAERTRHRLARLEKKIERSDDRQLFV